jgi:hypothetical protein
MFHVLWWFRKGSGLIGAYYLQLQAKGLIVYIVPINSGKWDRWREDWVIVRANVHNCLALLTESPTAKCSDWEEAPKLHVAYEPMIEKIKHLMRHGMSVMMVLHDFLSRSIAPLQDCACPALMYTGEGDTTQQEHGRESDFTPDVLDALLGRLSPDPSSVDFVTPPVVCAPMCSDEATEGAAHTGQYRHRSAAEG